MSKSKFDKQKLWKDVKKVSKRKVSSFQLAKDIKEIKRKVK